MGYLKVQIIVGRLGTDPVITQEEGMTVARFPVGTSLLYRKSGNTIRETEWHSVAVYGPKAKEAGKFLRKGGEVYVKGPWRTISYSESSTVSRIRTEVIAQDIKWPGTGRPGLLSADKLPDHIIIGDAPEGETQSNVEAVQTGLRIENLGAGLITPAGGVARSNAPGVSGGGAGAGRFKGGAGTAALGGIQVMDGDDDDETEFASAFINGPIDEMAELEDLSARIGTGQDTYFGRAPAQKKDKVTKNGDDEEPETLTDEEQPNL